MLRGLHQISISICLFCLSHYICAISVPCGKTCRIETSFNAIEVAFHFQQYNVVPVELVMVDGFGWLVGWLVEFYSRLAD